MKMNKENMKQKMEDIKRDIKWIAKDTAVATLGCVNVISTLVAQGTEALAEKINK